MFDPSESKLRQELSGLFNFVTFRVSNESKKGSGPIKIADTGEVQTDSVRADCIYRIRHARITKGASVVYFKDFEGNDKIVVDHSPEEAREMVAKALTNGLR
jgi:hypothetical protein